jgi:hypothetical protein
MGRSLVSKEASRNTASKVSLPGFCGGEEAVVLSTRLNLHSDLSMLSASTSVFLQFTCPTLFFLLVFCVFFSLLTCAGHRRMGTDHSPSDPCVVECC